MVEEHAGAEPQGREDDEPPRRSPPIFNLPGPVLGALALIAAVFACQNLLPAATVEALTIDLGFSPVRYIYPIAEQGGEYFWTPVTYSLLHGSVEHLLFNGLWLAAFGTPVARRIGAMRFIVFWIVSAAAGAFFHAAVNWGEATLMIGASAVVSALMGAACRFAFGGRARYLPPELAPLLSVREALRERTVVVFTIAWLIGNLAFAIGLPLFGDLGRAVAWDAHIGGFLLGFFGFSLFDPPQRRLMLEL